MVWAPAAPVLVKAGLLVRRFPVALSAFAACRTRFSTSRARSSKLDSLLDSKLGARFSVLLSWVRP
ncbi:hypothetical protein NQ246_26655, partial [Escherichia coli]|nr:hypothetical protein [Escherichia coli]